VIERAVILARGMGKRMRRSLSNLKLDPTVRKFAEKGWKPFVPIAGRPFIEYQLHELARMKIKELCLVVGPEHLELKEYFERIEKALGLRIRLAIQEKPLGTADALLASKSIIGDNEFILLNGDNFYPRNAIDALIKPEADGCYVAGFELKTLIEQSNFTPERVKSFSVIVADDNLNLVRVIEKPSNPEAYKTSYGILVSMNLWRFNSKIYEACSRIEPHPIRGEYELTSAVQYMVDNGIEKVKVIPVKSYVLDLTYASDIEAVENILRRVVENNA